jgi:hypothetical protein
MVSIPRSTGLLDLCQSCRAAIRRDADVLLDAPRPPVMKDFLDPTLCRRVTRPRKTRQVRVTFTVEELDVP